MASSGVVASGVCCWVRSFDSQVSIMSRYLRWLSVAVLHIAVVLSLAGAALAEVHAEAPHGTPTAHQDEGVPGLIPRGDLAFWSLVTFTLMMLVLGKFVWPALNDGLIERERKIRQDIADAEAGRHKSEAMVKEHEARLAKVQDEVREILAEARRDAEHAKLEIVTTAQKEAEATKQRAIAEIGRSKDQALAELFDFVSNNVLHATEHVIGRSLTGTDHERLVRESLAQLNVRRN